MCPKCGSYSNESCCSSNEYLKWEEKDFMMVREAFGSVFISQRCPTISLEEKISEAMSKSVEIGDLAHALMPLIEELHNNKIKTAHFENITLFEVGNLYHVVDKDGSGIYVAKWGCGDTVWETCKLKLEIDLMTGEYDESNIMQMLECGYGMKFGFGESEACGGVVRRKGMTARFGDGVVRIVQVDEFGEEMKELTRFTKSVTK
jgi:hypothetical protein